jgi:ubiquinone/menaquinone biosynthesis C-methylase UbiE
MSHTKARDDIGRRPRKRRADQYDDPNHNYLTFWRDRQYEHVAEELAVRRLLRGRRFTHAVDVGGGYGRLCVLLEKHAKEVTLADPSSRQLDLAADYLKDHPRIKRQVMQADDLRFEGGSIDLITMIRVMHHLRDPRAEFGEIARVLVPSGCAIIEVANYLHFRNRLKHLVRGERLPINPVDVRSPENRRPDKVPFVNHNPTTVVRQLADAGLQAEAALSVSNMRSPSVKKIIPQAVMLTVERMLQEPLAGMYFGPSIFFLVRKVRVPPVARYQLTVSRLANGVAPVA